MEDKLVVVFRDAFAAYGLDHKYGDLIVSSRPDLGDYQCNGAIQASRLISKNPMDVANDIVRNIGKNNMIGKITVAPPGYINITLSSDYIAELVNVLRYDRRLGCKYAPSAKKVLIDYGGPNIAKTMHVGHLRSAIIGDSIKRILRFVGHDVTGDIHLGDWGTPIGMLIYELQNRYLLESNDLSKAHDKITIEILEDAYIHANREYGNDANYRAFVSNIIVELHNRKSRFYTLWEYIRRISLRSIERDYSLLGVNFDVWNGESTYQDKLEMLVNTLISKNIAVEDNGAIIIRVGMDKDRQPMPPFFLKKKEGGYLYSTTDLAALLDRICEGYKNIYYVVDKRQALHFTQLFRAAKMAGVDNSHDLQHVAFGTMNGRDGKPFRTRSGNVMKLRDLYDLIIQAAKRRMSEVKIGDQVTVDERDSLAAKIGIAALKFGDLKHEKTTDYIFDIDEYSKFEGYTGPYVQYAAVRIISILKKVGNRDIFDSAPILPGNNETERKLMLKLLELPKAIYQSSEKLAPHIICMFAHDLAHSFNMFYQDNPILNEEQNSQRESRLSLCMLCLREIELVLSLLGIDIPDRM